MIAQLNPAYYDSNGKVIVGDQPEGEGGVEADMQASRRMRAPASPRSRTDWNTGFKKGTFATVTCPAWMMGYIQGQAPKTKGKWDIAAVPGGGGNWGGSFLAIPKQGRTRRRPTS